MVGNPSDPANMESTASSSGAGGMSFQDRMLSNSVARSVMRITHGLDEWDEKMTVSTDPGQVATICASFPGPRIVAR